MIYHHQALNSDISLFHPLAAHQQMQCQRVWSYGKHIEHRQFHLNGQLELVLQYYHLIPS